MTKCRKCAKDREKCIKNSKKDATNMENQKSRRRKIYGKLKIKKAFYPYKFSC